MPLISISVPNLVNGVSQQPDSLRYPSQCDEQINAYCSVAEGLTKRPPTNHIAKIWSAPGETFNHTINRDSSERYAVVVRNGELKVFDVLTGEEKTVVVADGSASYITSEQPKTDLRAITVADYTFILNRTKVTALTTDKTPDPNFKAFVTVIQADYEKKYSIIMGAPVSSGAKAAITYSTSDLGVSESFKFQAKVEGTEFNNVVIITKYVPNTTGVVCKWDSALQQLVFTYGLNTKTSEATLLTAVLNSNTARDVWDVVHITGSSTLQFDIARINGATTTGGSASYGTKNTYTITSSATAADIRTDKIIDDFYAALTDGTTGLNGSAGPCDGYNQWVVDKNGSTLRIKRTDNADFKIQVQDSLSNTGMSLVKGQVEKVSSLPLTCEHNYVTKITGLADASEDDYWVRFKAENAGNGQYPLDQGVWEEASEPNTVYKIDGATMPHVLIRESDGSGGIQFRFQPADWKNRLVGDDETNPQSSFINSKINSLFFFRNRLGILSGENVVLSESGDVFNFWRTTVLSLLDGDPIDVASNHTKVSILYHAIPFTERCILFSEQTQFVLKGGDVLSPKTVSITQTSEYSNLSGLAPTAAGDSIFFGFTRGSFTGVSEYTADTQTDRLTATEITAHVPKYIEGTITKLTSSDNEKVLVAMADGYPNGVFVYKYFVQGQEKLQSAWFKFDFGEAVTVRNVDFIDSTLYLILERGGDLFLEYMELKPGLKDEDANYTVFLDRRIPDGNDDVTMSYDAPSDRTTITLPYDVPSGVEMQVVTMFEPDESFGVGGGVKLEVVSQTTNTIVVSGDYTEYSLWIGEKYTMTYTFSKPVLKETSAGGGRAIIATGRLQIRTGYLVFADSRFFKIVVTPKARAASSFTYSGASFALGTTDALLGSAGTFNGKFQFMVRCQNTQVTVQAVNDSPFPSALLSVDWEGMYYAHSQRFNQ